MITARRSPTNRLLFEQKSLHQHLIIFENTRFGRVMTLDGIIQTTEGDEFIYHEMLTHVPLFAHGDAQDVLIIGGGDGGILREVTKHQTVRHITQVEIDEAVIQTCREYLPNHAQGAFDDPRLTLIIDDGMAFVEQTQQRFDIIISDSTDPIGPGEVLFSSAFYEACRLCLKPARAVCCPERRSILSGRCIDNIGATLAFSLFRRNLLRRRCSHLRGVDS